MTSQSCRQRSQTSSISGSLTSAKTVSKMTTCIHYIYGNGWFVGWFVCLQVKRKTTGPMFMKIAMTRCVKPHLHVPFIPWGSYICSCSNSPQKAVISECSGTVVSSANQCNCAQKIYMYNKLLLTYSKGLGNISTVVALTDWLYALGEIWAVPSSFTVCLNPQFRKITQVMKLFDWQVRWVM